MLSADRMPTFRFRVSSDGKAKREFCESNLRGQVDLLFVFVVEAVCCLLSADRMPAFRFRVSSDGKVKREFE